MTRDSHTMHTQVHILPNLHVSLVNPILAKLKGLGLTLSPLARTPLMVAGRLANFVNT